jgi:hypothetical protein
MSLESLFSNFRKGNRRNIFKHLIKRKIELRLYPLVQTLISLTIPSLFTTLPFYFEHNLTENRLRAAVADTLGDVQIKHGSKSVQKFIFWTLVAALHHKRTTLCLDKENTGPAVLGDLK